MQSKEYRAAYARGLRELADFIESQDVVPVPTHTIFNLFAKTKAELMEWRRGGGGKWDKADVFDNYIILRKSFGGDVIKLDLNLAKENSCMKVQVGTRVVPAEPAREARPERVEPVYKWLCDDSLIHSAGVDMSEISAVGDMLAKKNSENSED